MRVRLLAVAMGFVFGAGALAQPGQPWMNTALGPDARADLIQKELTRDEELTLVDGYLGINYQRGFHEPIPAAMKPLLPASAGYVPGIPRLGIPALTESDASLGVANGGNMRPGDTAVALPSSLLSAATFNPALAYESGAMVGREARAKGFNVMLAGGVNLAREPRGGRTFEYAGEDPLLAGLMVGESIRGIQSQGIISTAKHFAFNDQETARTIMSVTMEEGEARESDLLAFEIALERGDPGAIMCSYNRVKRVYACENPNLLIDVLRSDWGYQGFVLSDWGAVHSTVTAVMAGLDQESSNGSDARDYFGAPLREAIVKGDVPESRLHQMVHRILRTMFAKGLFDRPLVKGPIDVSGDLAVAQRAAEEGIVLLKNEKNLLPLDPNKKHQKVALIGGFADRGVLSGGGSSQVHGIGHSPAMMVQLGGGTKVIDGVSWNMPRDTAVLHGSAPLTEIKKLAAKARVTFNSGEDIDAAVAAAKKADVAIVFAWQYMHEGSDVIDLALPGNQNDLIQAVAAANPNTVVILETGGPVTMPWLDNVAGVIEAFYPGNGGAAALARILFGEIDPSGRLPVTFPLAESQLPHPIIAGQRPDQRILPTNGTPTFYDVIYQEGGRIGYRWFEDQKLMAQYPFGYGLSYTSFAYENLKLTGAATVKAEFDVRNTGKRPGKTVAQVYVKPPYGPSRLVGFEKVALNPGETKHVVLYADKRLIAMFDADANQWTIADGDYQVRIGAFATDKAATGTVHVNAGTVKP